MIYYATFGQRHALDGVPLKDYYTEVEANSEENATTLLIERYGDQWSQIYHQKDFDPSWYKEGLFEKLKVLDEEVNTLTNLPHDIPEN